MNFVPAPLVSDHYVPPSSIALLKTLPGIPSNGGLTITAQYLSLCLIFFFFLYYLRCLGIL
jgi:hypothetical protein